MLVNTSQINIFFVPIILGLAVSFSFASYAFNLHTSEASFIEVATVLCYCVAMLLLVNAKRHISYNILFAGVILLFVLTQREMNLIRNVFSVFVSVEYYRQYFVKPIFATLLMLEMLFAYRILKNDFNLMKCFLLIEY